MYHLSTYLSSMYLYIHLSMYMPVYCIYIIYLSNYLSTFLSIYLSTYPSMNVIAFYCSIETSCTESFNINNYLFAVNFIQECQVISSPRMPFIKELWNYFGVKCLTHFIPMLPRFENLYQSWHVRPGSTAHWIPLVQLPQLGSRVQ